MYRCPDNTSLDMACRTHVFLIRGPVNNTKGRQAALAEAMRIKKLSWCVPKSLSFVYICIEILFLYAIFSLEIINYWVAIPIRTMQVEGFLYHILIGDATAVSTLHRNTCL